MAAMSEIAYRRPRWLLSDAWRSSGAVVLAIVLSFGAMAVLLWLVPQLRDPAQFQLLSMTIVFTFYPLAYTALTWWAFGGLRGAELRHAVDAESARWRQAHERGRTWLRTLVMGGRALGWSLAIAITTLILVMGVALIPGLRQLAVVPVMALVMVAASWASVVMTYAVHYARVETESPGGLGFPEEAERSFRDYVYVAVAGQTTFGATDVERRTPRMRSISTAQGLLAFVYSTVIVAIIISLMLAAGTS